MSLPALLVPGTVPEISCDGQKRGLRSSQQRALSSEGDGRREEGKDRHSEPDGPHLTVNDVTRSTTTGTGRHTVLHAGECA